MGSLLNSMPASRRMALAFLAATLPGTTPYIRSARAQAVRVALVIGNGAYRSVTPLQNPRRDARAAANAFARLGFRTELLLDGGQAAMRDALHWLGEAAGGAEAAVFYYAGHALEAAGRNLLLPVSVTARGGADGLEREAVSFDEVTAALQGRARTTLVFLDACRDNPFRAPSGGSVAGAGRRGRQEGRAPAGMAMADATRSVGGGLAGVASGSGMLIAFATAPGQVALDGQDENSPFTEALLRHIETPAVEVRQMLGRVRQSVREATAGMQIPWDNSSLEGSFYFRPPTADPAFRRTIEAASGRSIPLPPDLQARAFRPVPGRIGRLVGSWGGDNRWGGRGRQIILVVLSVDEAGKSADVIEAWGPSTSQAYNPNAPAGWAKHIAAINGEALEFSHRDGWRYSFRIAGEDELLGVGVSPQGAATRIRIRRIE